MISRLWLIMYKHEIQCQDLDVLTWVHNHLFITDLLYELFLQEKIFNSEMTH